MPRIISGAFLFIRFRVSTSFIVYHYHMNAETIGLLPQNHTDCLSIIQSSGCFARSSQGIAELATGRRLSADQVNDIWLWGKARRIFVNGKQKLLIDGDNALNSSAMLANRTLEVLGMPGRFLEVGTKKNGIITWYDWVKGSAVQRADAHIQKIAQNGPQKFHFRIVDADDQPVWDPHVPAILSQGVLYTIIYCFQADFGRESYDKR